MISDTRQCSCEGANSDCFRCNGTGMVQLRDTKRQHSDAFVIGQMLISRPKRPEKKLPIIVAAKPSKLKINKNQIECPICCIYIPKIFSFFFNHLKSHNSQDKIKNQRQIIKAFKLIDEPPPAIQSNGLKKKKPPYNHTNQVHNSKKQKSTIAASFTRESKLTTDPTSRYSALNEDIFKKLDATYGHHVIRERGRFRRSGSRAI